MNPHPSLRPSISLRGVRVHNLKSIDLEIPRGKLTVVTGPSGSGKSSLAFDTLYAEGQRRYVETLSPYVRQFLERMEKPECEAIEGILPAIAVGQSGAAATSRSTLGTMSGILDYLKSVYARAGRLFCPDCHLPVEAATATRIAEELLEQFQGAQLGVGFPIEFPEGTDRRQAFSFLRSQGLLRVWEKGTLVRTDEEPEEGLVDGRLIVALRLLRVEEAEKSRLTQGIEEAMRLGKGRVAIRPADGQSRVYTHHRLCSGCGREFPAPTPALFSFNNPQGACPSCHGFGRVVEFDRNRAIPEPSRSVRGGAIQPFRSGSLSWWQRRLEKSCLRRGIRIDTPFAQLSHDEREFIVEGERPADEAEAALEAGFWCGVRGFFSILEKKAYKTHVRVFLSRYRDYRPCPECGGVRFTALARAYRLSFPSGDLSIAEFCSLPVREARRRLASLSLPPSDPASRRAWEETLVRLQYLEEIGLGYLSLDRPTRSLSGGEIRRANLTICLGNSLSNTLFVLDEPTIGLHPRDVHRLLAVMRHLRDQGNTVVVVEHEEMVIRGADHLVELGPGRGPEGGSVVFSGSPTEMVRSPRSLTGAYLSGRKTIPHPTARRPVASAHRLRLSRIHVHNLRDLAVDLPLGRFVAVTGVSGSGKSSLVHDALAATLRSALARSDKPMTFSGQTATLSGWDDIAALYEVDQAPLSRTPRSNLALYVKAWEPLRQLFAQTEDALSRGLTALSFSLNAGDGRCPHCEGSGVERVEMQFLADLFLPCPICQGRRFQPHVLAVRLCGQTLEELLSMSVTEAVGFLQPEAEASARENRLRRQAVRRLEGLAEIGLGYLRLGHPLSQLSGGESQRLKVWSHLAGGIDAGGGGTDTRAKKRGAQAALFLLDEPTTGLHADDLPALLRLFQRIVDQGNSLVVVEHNLEVIRSADWVIELGPEGGAEGGKVVAEGDPESIASDPASHTGRFLRDRLEIESSRPALLPEGSFPPSATSLSPERLAIRNAHHHNLKSLSLDITLGSFTVLTGVSGSGKSTLAFDILFTEGQRRYLDCLSGYARQFVEQMEKPAVEAVTGLPPTVAIEQRLTRPGAKSTVATVAEIFPFLRLLYARLGVPADPETGETAQQQSLSALLAEVVRRLTVPQRLLAPVVRGRKGNYAALGRWAARKKVPGLRIDGRWVDPGRFTGTHRYRTHSIDVWLATLLPGSPDTEVERLVAQALALGRETIVLVDPQGKESLLSTRYFCPGSGRSFDELDPRLFSFHSPVGWCPDCQGSGSVSQGKEEAEEETPCPSCRGSRLNPVAASVRVPLLPGERGIGPTLPEICRLSVEEAISYFSRAPVAGRAAPVLAKIFPEVLTRLRFLEQAGLSYLELDRSAPTLSAGEMQRIHLAAQLGSNLQGVLYVLDEPTIGLHAQENARLLDTLGELQAKGNTLVVVEHDEETIRRADRVIDLGPGAGRFGGHIVADGPWTSFVGDPVSVTGRLLGTPLRHPLSGHRRPCGACEPRLRIEGIEVHNLHNLSVSIPLGRLVVLCGVSGSGKSTFLHRALFPAVLHSVARSSSERTQTPRPCWKKVSGADTLSAAVLVDQTPIGKTSRSTPATYLGVFDQIRELFASLPTSRERGYAPGRFSYNTSSGRCPACQGNGTLAVELPLLPLFRIPCEACSGKRYDPQTLEIEYRERTIADILEMTVEEAASFFAGVPRLRQALELVTEAGLGYLTLGQPSPTLSGGEAQRLKLAAELAASLVRPLPRSLTPAPPKRSLYLLEEPTIGLHLADVERLLRLCQRLVDLGHTVVLIEHHLDVVAEADHVIELGPGAAEAGGRIIAQGPPEKIARVKRSPTAPFLRPVLARAGGRA